MTRFYVLRHGDIANPDQVLYLQMDEEIVLTRRGERQIREQGRKLRDCQIKAIIYSPLRRTRQSAEIVEKELHTSQMMVDKRLVDSGSPAQGMKMAEFDKVWEGNLYHPGLVAKGGESLQDIKKRMMSAVEEWAGEFPDQSIVLVSHGDPIRILTMTAEGVELDKANLGSDRYPVSGISYPEKGSVTVLEYSEKKLEKTDYWPASVKFNL